MHKFKQIAILIWMVLFVSVPLAPSQAAIQGHKPTHVTVVAWNEKSFPEMSAAAYSHDFNKVLPMGRNRTVFMLSEISTPTQKAILKKVAAREGLRTHGIYRDVATVTRAPSNAYKDTYFTSSTYFHKKVAGPASPARRVVQSYSRVDGHVVDYVALHLTNGCLDHNKLKWWYSARCKAVQEEIQWVKKRIIAPNYKDNFTTVIVGDMNKRELIHWAYRTVPTRQVSVPVQSLMQMAVIPARHLDAHLKITKVLHKHRDVRTDHDIRFADFWLTKR